MVALSLDSLMRRAICSLLSIMVWVKVKPLASIAFTACSVTRPTSLANSVLLPVIALRRPLDFSSRMRVISAERWLSALVTSSALPTKLRATSALTPSNVRSTSLAFCLSTLLTPVDIPVRLRSASWALERIAVVVVDASCASERSASPALVLIASLSCSSRAPITAVVEVASEPIARSASAVVVLIVWAISSARETMASVVEPVRPAILRSASSV